MKKPILKTPPPPEHAYMDLDAPLFAAASAGEQVVYTGVTPEGEEVARFNSASAYKNWLEISEDFGIDMEFGFTGDLSTLTRQVDYEPKPFEECTKAFDYIIEKWLKKSGCKDWTGYVSKASGEKNFRYDVATVKAYKGGRKESRKPLHLEALRKYARSNPKIKVPRGPYEVDDLVCAQAQKKGWKGCVVGVDKDALQVKNTYVLMPDTMDKPQFSSQKIVGRLYRTDSGKVLGYGTLFALWQAIGGDPVDSIPGCLKVGSVGAYERLREFDGACSTHLAEAVGVVCGTFKRAYGEVYEYEHCTTQETVTATYKELAIEMSKLVYMKKSKADECFWIPLIEDYVEEA